MSPVVGDCSSAAGRQKAVLHRHHREIDEGLVLVPDYISGPTASGVAVRV
jgi:hypothetical protein